MTTSPANGSTPNGIDSNTTTKSRSGPPGPTTTGQNGAYGPLDDVPSILDIKRVLPKHCFDRDLRRSMYYVGKDLGIVLALYVVMRAVEWSELWWLRLLVTPVYGFLQGTMMWAMFVLGHDCGHGSFSKYSLVNDVMGTFLHAPLLVPFYPWKLSHHHHHKNTGNIDKDEIFYPTRERDHPDNFKPLHLFYGGVSWFAYLWSGYYPRKVNHLNPFEPMFAAHVLGCFFSLGALVVWVGMLLHYWSLCGLPALLLHYGVPCFIFASWLVVVTFLHHTEVGVSWYGDTRWNYVRGQLSSVDRDYGWAHSLTHNIGTHQIHHLFLLIPHYHLEEATKAFRAVYPQFVRRSSLPIIPSFCRMFRIFLEQRHVSDTADVHTYEPIKAA